MSPNSPRQEDSLQVVEIERIERVGRQTLHRIRAHVEHLQKGIQSGGHIVELLLRTIRELFAIFPHALARARALLLLLLVSQLLIIRIIMMMIVIPVLLLAGEKNPVPLILRGSFINHMATIVVAIVVIFSKRPAESQIRPSISGSGDLGPKTRRFSEI